MVKDYTIGLNEVKLGIVAPSWLIANMIKTIGTRPSELALTSGTLFTTGEALKIGLVDEVAADKTEALAKAQAFFKRFAKIHPIARSFTKQAIRGRDVKALEKNKQKDLDQFLMFVNNPMVQAGLEKYMEALKKK